MRDTVSVYVDVDVCDVLDHVSDKEIQKLAEERGLKFKHVKHDDLIEAIERIISATERRDLPEANRLASHLLDEVCGCDGKNEIEKKWEKIKNGQHPFLRLIA